MTDNSWNEDKAAQQDKKTPSISDDWEQDVLERMLFASLKEQRRTRRWSNFFKILFFAYLFIMLFAFWPGSLTKSAKTKGLHTALVNIEGIIADGEQASASRIINSLQNAFENEEVVGVILRINSPGGSAVQSGYVYDEIVRLRGLYPDKKLYAVAADLCASGGYYIASAADEIYANQASLVGSLGVIYSGFGFVDAMDKLGVERRLLTAGDNKALMDPFSPENTQQTAHTQTMLDEIHQQFIESVRLGRGDRLQESDDLYSGLIWTGETAVTLGLIDGLASVGTVARDVIGEETVIDYTVSAGLFDRIASRFGASIAQGLLRNANAPMAVHPH